eukprot:5612574-Amphidinium_carterae.3
MAFSRWLCFETLVGALCTMMSLDSRHSVPKVYKRIQQEQLMLHARGIEAKCSKANSLSDYQQTHEAQMFVLKSVKRRFCDSEAKFLDA